MDREDAVACALADELAPRFVISSLDDDSEPLGKRCRIVDAWSDGESSCASDDAAAVHPPAVKISDSHPRAAMRVGSSSEDEAATGSQTASAAVGHGPKRWRVGLCSGQWVHARDAPHQVLFNVDYIFNDC